MGVVHVEAVTGKIRVSLTRIVCTGFLAPDFLSGGKNFFLVQGGYLSHGSLMPCFRKEGQGRMGVRVTFLLLLFSQIPPPEEIQYGKVPYFGVLYPEPLHYQLYSHSSHPYQNLVSIILILNDQLYVIIF